MAQIDSTTNNSESSIDTSSQTITETKNLDPKELIKEDAFLSFTKQLANHGPDSVLFNSIIVHNIFDKPVSGVLSINLPVGWTCSGKIPSGIALSLAPNEKKRIPLWITLDNAVKGNHTYVLTGKFKFDDQKTKPELTSGYVKIPARSKWTISLPQNSVYFNNRNKYAPFTLKIENKGNVIEVIKIEITAGENLTFKDFLSPSDEFHIELEPNKDTTFLIEVRYVTPDNIFISQSQKFNSVKIKATNGVTKVKSVVFNKLPNKYNNGIGNMKHTPLTVDVISLNLLSTPAFTVQTRGEILFPQKDHSLFYRLNFRNMRRTSTVGFGKNLWINGNYIVEYTNKNNTLTLGNITSSGFGLNYAGRGIKVSSTVFGSHQISVSYNRNIIFPIHNYGVDYSGAIKGIGYSIGASEVIDNFNLINFRNAGGVVSFSPFKTQTFSLKYSRSIRNHRFQIGDFPFVEDENQTLKGFMAGITHHFKLIKFNAYTSFEYSSPFHSGRINNTTILRNSMGYKITDNTSISSSLNFTNSYQYIVRQGIRMNNPDVEMLNTRVNLIQRLSGNLTASIGGRYNNNQITYYYAKALSRFTNETNNYALNVRLKYKINSNQSVSGNIENGFYKPISLYVDPNYPNSIDYSKNYTSSRVSLNYRQRSSGVSLVFVRGIINQNSVSNFNTTITNQTFILRPYLSKTYYDNRLIIRAFANVMIQTARQSETYGVNVSPELKLKHGWSARSSINVNLNKRTIAENEVLNNRSVFINFAIKKQFDFQQPRTKYHDLTIVFFKDINGNRIKDENEPTLENIITNVRRCIKPALGVDSSETANNAHTLGKFTEMDLISDNQGTIIYNKIPEGSFDISFFPLEKLEGFFHPGGPMININIIGNTTLFVPFSEGFKVRGTLIVNKDKNSTVKKLSLANIPVLAVDENGFIFKSLTDNSGRFNIALPPKPGIYKVKIINAFGVQYQSEQSEYEISFNGLKTFEVDFVFNEKERGINVNGSNGYQFNALTGKNNEIEMTNVDGINVPKPKCKDSTTIYRVQVMATKLREMANPYPDIADLSGSSYDDGNTRFFVGNYTTKVEAKNRIKQLQADGFIGSFVRVFENCSLLPAGTYPNKPNLTAPPVISSPNNKPTNAPTIDPVAEKKLWEKTDDLQRQIDELRKLKQDLLKIQSQQEQSLKDINKAKEDLEEVKAKSDAVTPAINPEATPLTKPAPKATTAPQLNMENQDIDELEDLINQLIEKTNPTVNYRVEFGVFKDEMPTSFFNQLIKFGSVEVSDNEGGESRFRSKPYYSYKEAQDYATFLKQQSIEGVKIIGEKSGLEIPLEEVQKIMNE